MKSGVDDKNKLVFEPETHTYIVNDTPVPCVSDVIAPYGEEPDGELELAMESAAERGTVCHAVLEQYMQGDYSAEYPSAYTGYVEGIRLFLSEHSIQPIAAEVPIYSDRLGVAGTPDLLCSFDGGLALLYYKFVSQISKTKVKAQLNAYRLIYEDYGVFVDGLYAVQFLPGGEYRLYPVEISDTEIHVAMELYRLKKKKHPRGRIA